MKKAARRPRKRAAKKSNIMKALQARLKRQAVEVAKLKRSADQKIRKLQVSLKGKDRLLGRAQSAAKALRARIKKLQGGLVKAKKVPATKTRGLQAEVRRLKTALTGREKEVAALTSKLSEMEAHLREKERWIMELSAVSGERPEGSEEE